MHITTLNLKIELKEAPGQNLSLRFCPTESDANAFCLALTMLHYGVIDVLIPSRHALRVIKLPKKQLAKIAPNHGGYAVRMPDKWLELRVTDAALDRWIHFYLVYYRDGSLNVDHFDESIYPDKRHLASIPVELTFMVPISTE